MVVSGLGFVGARLVVRRSHVARHEHEDGGNSALHLVGEDEASQREEPSDKGGDGGGENRGGNLRVDAHLVTAGFAAALTSFRFLSKYAIVERRLVFPPTLARVIGASSTASSTLDTGAST